MAGDTVYIHSFDGLSGHLFKIGADDTLTRIEVKAPAIADIGWNHTDNSLIISNQLNAQQWRLTEQQLQPFPLSDTEVLSQLHFHGKQLVATQTRPNMDIYLWRKGALQSVVAGKYPEYQGAD